MSHSLSKLLLLYAQQFEDQHAPQNMTIALREAAKELDRLRERLEIDPAHPYDGIYCRDETIRLQDAEITRLTAEVKQNAIDLEEYRRDVEKLRAALRECEAELNAYYRMEYPGDHPYSQKKLALAMASNPATVALSGEQR